MIKLKFLLLLFLLSSVYSKAQINDTIKSTQVIVIGIKEFNNPILLLPNNTGKEKAIRIKRLRKVKRLTEVLPVVIEKEKIENFTLIKKKNFRYLSLDTNCYITFFSILRLGFIEKHIIPVAPEKYLPVLNETYSKSFGIEKIKQFSYGCDDYEYIKKYKYCDIPHHKYLLVLMHAPLYNRYCFEGVRPPTHRFRGDKAEQGIYFKLLIPILEDFEDSVPHGGKEKEK